MRKTLSLVIIIALLLSLCSCTLSAKLPEITEDDGFEAVFLDVGQADCIYIHCGDARMLIDGGNREDGMLVTGFLKNRGVEKLDYVVSTHPHEDHCGGLTSVLNDFDVGTVYSPVEEYDSQVFCDMKDAAEKQKLELTIPNPGDTFMLGTAKVTVLGPVGTYEDTNDMSIVLKLEYGSNSFIFTGDAGYDADMDIMEKNYSLDADVLKAGHHGSSSANGYVWIREIMPEYAVISVGEGNDYGHPSEKTLSRFHDAGTEVYRTDINGTVTIKSDGKNLTVETEK